LTAPKRAERLRRQDLKEAFKRARSRPCVASPRERILALLDFLKTAFATLLVTLDPPGLAPIFIGLTAGMSRGEKRQVALRGSIIAFAILAAFALGGAEVMKALGISMPAFRIAGGVMLFWIAFGMIFDLRPQRKETLAADAITIDHIRNVAAFPLAIPLMAGPGAITATILLAGRAGADWEMLTALLIIIAATMALCYLTFLTSERVAAMLGATGNIVLTRLLGVILAALAVHFIIDGIAGIGK
jgi:multiple antibiotic resistance protein